MPDTMTTDTKPEPSLRVQCAKIMGWHAISAEYLVGLPPDVKLPSTEAILAGEVNMWPIPAFDTSCDAALTLKDALYEKGWVFLVEHHLSSEIKVRFVHVGTGRESHAKSCTLSLSICKAFIAAHEPL